MQGRLRRRARSGRGRGCRGRSWRAFCRSYVNVDVDINVRHAGLCLGVRAALMPWSGTAARIAHLGKPKAFPGAATRKLALADFARKLPRQRGFLTALVAPEDKQAKLAMTAAIPADRLLLGQDGSAEDGVGGRGHSGNLVTDPWSYVGYRHNCCKRHLNCTTKPEIAKPPA